MVINADCIEHMNTMPPESVDSIVTDPPYHLTSKNGQSKGFMGKEWDGGNIAFRTEVWEAALRVAKPGAYLLAFGGTRTFHRMAVAIEDAGWEIRDTVMWVYGSGFPKSHDVGKGIDKAGGADVEEQGHALRARRIALGMSLESVATQVGCAPATLNNWEQGRQRKAGGPLEFLIPAPAFRAKLASVLGYSLDARVITGEVGSDKRGSVTHDFGHRGIEYGDAATNLAKQWDGWGTALKPAWEPIIVARKPLEGTVAANVLEHGTGAMNIDGCRVGDERLGGGTMPDLRDVGAMSKEASGIDKMSFGQNPRPAKRKKQSVYTGRWPANLIHDGSDEVVRLFPDGGAFAPVRRGHSGKSNGIYGDFAQRGDDGASFRNDTGSAARFFYCAKTSRADRDEGCDGIDERKRDAGRKEGNPGGDNPRNRGVHERRNHHPTVKPTALMRYLCKLVTRLGGVVLDPFCGSDSTGKAAILEGFKFIGIEKEFEYCEIANARISKTDM